MDYLKAAFFAVLVAFSVGCAVQEERTAFDKTFWLEREARMSKW